MQSTGGTPTIMSTHMPAQAPTSTYKHALDLMRTHVPTEPHAPSQGPTHLLEPSPCPEETPKALSDGSASSTSELPFVCKGLGWEGAPYRSSISSRMDATVGPEPRWV